MVIYRKLKDSFRDRLKSEFLRNTVTLMTGTTISQIIPIITAPIITRLYLPEFYGIMGIYMSVSGLLGIISTLSYTSAILLPEKDEDALSVLHLCMVSTFLWSLLIAIFSLLLHKQLALMMHTPEVSIYFFLLPFSVIAGGWGTSFSAWANRKKQYKIISASRVTASILTAIASISIGFIWNGPGGLITGLLVSQLTIPVMLFYQINKTTVKIFPINSKAVLIRQAALFKNFPKYSLPSDFINNFINQLPIYMLGLYAGKAEVGHYNLSNRILGLPITFISSAVSEVFKQKASSDYAKYRNCRQVFVKTFKTLFALSIVPFIAIIILSPFLFSFVFGHQWKEAGVYTQLMAIMFFMKFTISPLSFTFYLANKQRYDLLINVYLTVTTLFIFFFLLKISVMYALLAYSLNYTSIYLLTLFLSYRYAKNNNNN